jgi:nucleotide-binding universal stress UspA family protein
VSSVILVLLDRPEAAPGVLAAAARLAELTAAGRIISLVIRTPPEATILPSEEVLGHHDALRIRAEEQQRSDALKQAYEAWRPPGIATEWEDIEGLADRLASEWGRRADFIVLRRQTGHDTDQEQRMLNAALFNTDRPVLVVPPDRPPGAFGRRIGIAWRADERTVKSVLSGLQGAGRAEEIHVLAGVRDASTPPGLPDVIAEHGIVAQLHVLPISNQRAFGEQLLECAHQLSIDMLVMGAFAHNPLRTLLLGGVTRYMLAHADLPVLMRH